MKPKKARVKPAKKIRAICLLSGGLDSAIAAKLVEKQGIDVHCIFFKTPFFASGEDYARNLAEKMEMPFETIELGKKYFQMLRDPKHGYGSALNPCIDCHTLMLKEAWKYAKKIGAKFIITGEVLGQRPMSQNKRELDTIEKESGLKGKILRPLSAKLLEKTEAQKKKWITIDSFPEISGRGRNEQFALAKQMGIRRFQSPAGGCLLTHREYSAKVIDLLGRKENISKEDIEILKVGRHFSFGKAKIIVGKNFEENQKLLKMKKKDEYFFEAEEKIPSPITIIQGSHGKKELEVAAKLTAYYSDAKSKSAKIFYGKEKLEKSIKVKIPKDEEVDSMRIVWHSGKCD